MSSEISPPYTNPLKIYLKSLLSISQLSLGALTCALIITSLSINKPLYFSAISWQVFSSLLLLYGVLTGGNNSWILIFSIPSEYSSSYLLIPSSVPGNGSSGNLGLATLMHL